MIPLVIWYWTKHLIVSQIKYYLWCWKWAKFFNRCRAIVHAVFQNTRKDNKVVFRCWGGVRGEALSFYFHFICCPHQCHPVNHTTPPRTISFGSQVTEVLFLWKPTQPGSLLPENGFTKEGLFQCIPWVPDSNCKATMSSAPPSSSLLNNREERKHGTKAWYVEGEWMGTLLKMKG